MTIPFAPAAPRLLRLGLCTAAAILAGALAACSHTPTSGIGTDSAAAEPRTESASLRERTPSVISRRPGRGESPNCLQLLRLQQSRSECIALSSMDEPTAQVVLTPNGRTLVKLNAYLKADSLMSFQIWQQELAAGSSGRRERLVDAFDTNSVRDEAWNKRMAVSPDGRALWLVRKADRLVGSRGDVLRQGELDRIDLDTGAVQPMGFQALGGHPVQPLGDQHIVFSRALPRNEALQWLAQAPLAQDTGFAASRLREAWVPVVFVRHLASGDEWPVHIGTRAFVGPAPSDSQGAIRIVVEDDDRQLRLVTLGTAQLSSRSTWHGMSQPLAAAPHARGPGVGWGLIGWAGADTLAYWATPDPRATPGTTTFNSPLVGPKPLVSWRVQALDLAGATPRWTDEGYTALAQVDPRSRPSIAVVTASPGSASIPPPNAANSQGTPR
jgi:hypothetical protein